MNVQKYSDEFNAVIFTVKGSFFLGSPNHLSEQKADKANKSEDG